MATLHNRLKQSDEKWVIWQQPPSGDPMAPYDDPVANMDLVRFCSEFQYFNSNERHNGLSVNHSSVAGVTGSGYAPPSGGGSSGPIANGQIVVTDKLLYTHSRGVVPQFMVLFNDAIVGATVVQETTGKKKTRMVSAYATTTEIRLLDIGISSTDALPSITLSYDLILFGNLAEVPGDPLFQAKPDSVIMGYGRVSSEQTPLRRVVGAEDFFYLPFDQSVAVRTGGMRSVSPFGSNDIGPYLGTFFSSKFLKVTL